MVVLFPLVFKFIIANLKLLMAQGRASTRQKQKLSLPVCIRCCPQIPSSHERPIGDPNTLLSPQNLHVYISEHEHFTDFNATSALFWEQHDLVYGDWTSGENSDGCYEHFAELDIPQVTPTLFWPGSLQPPRVWCDPQL